MSSLGTLKMKKTTMVNILTFKPTNNLSRTIMAQRFGELFMNKIALKLTLSLLGFARKIKHSNESLVACIRVSQPTLPLPNPHQ
jgi:hypothetical protein